MAVLIIIVLLIVLVVETCYIHELRKPIDGETAFYTIEYGQRLEGEHEALANLLTITNRKLERALELVEQYRKNIERYELVENETPDWSEDDRFLNS